jgi:two-component system nitrogen regulation sensor histidine kinase GlnL
VLLTLRPRGADAGAPEPTDSPALAGLSGMLAHEIKNPLAGIRGAAQLLKSGVPAADAPLAQLIMDEVDRIHRLVDSMAAFADPVRNVAQHEPVNIHAVLDRVRALAVNGVAGAVSLHESFDPSLPSTPGDEDQLIQVFLNLVKNAAEATEARGDGRGEIMLTTRFVQGFRMRDAAGRWRATPLEVRVQDNGPGVPESLRAHLFEPFVTSKPQGAGLGLPLVARLVSAHGGLIEFDSEPGRTVFRVRLPICDDNRSRREVR